MHIKLQLLTKNKTLENFYKNHKCNFEEDSGLDLAFPNDITVKPGDTIFIPLDIGIEPTDTKSGCYLFPRSSIWKTPLRLSNSVGIIDNNYRGCIGVSVDNIKKYEYTIKKGTRLFQLCGADLLPITFTLVDELTKTKRGKGGFGSTGK